MPATPTRRATSSATACASSTRSTATVEPTVLLHADVVDHPLAPLEDADPLPRAPLPRRHLRRARQRPLRPPARARRLPRGGVRSRRARGAGRDRDRAGGLVSLSRGAERSLHLAANHPERVDRHGVHRSGSAAAAGDPAPASDAGLQRAARRVHRLGEMEPSLLGRALRGLPRVLLLAVLHRAALDQAARGSRSAGASRRTPRRWSRPSSRRGSRTRRACASSCSRIDCPVLVDPRKRRRRPPVRIRRAAGRAGGRRRSSCSRDRATCRMRATRSRSTSLLRDFIVPAPPPRALGTRQGATQARPLRLLPDRARPRAARRGDRRRAAEAPSRPRDRLARAAPGDGGARGARRAHPPGER